MGVFIKSIALCVPLPMAFLKIDEEELSLVLVRSFFFKKHIYIYTCIKHTSTSIRDPSFGGKRRGHHQGGGAK